MLTRRRLLAYTTTIFIVGTFLLSSVTLHAVSQGDLLNVDPVPDTVKPGGYPYPDQKQNDGSKRGKGPCQEIICLIDTSACYPVPDTDVFLYFRSCLGDSVMFAAKGIYPEAGLPGAYTQNDTLHTFYWSFGDGTDAVTDANVVWHKYDSAKGYDVSMYIVDTNNCSGIPVVCRVTVTQNPINYIKPLPQKCLGDTSQINSATFTTFTPYSYSQVSSQKFDSTLFIPDGLACNPDNPCYLTDVIFTSFLPSQVIASGDDILSVCVEMEHSYIGDLSIVLKCPNGQTDTLKAYIHLGNSYMGIPKGGVNHHSFDNDQKACDAGENPFGTPWPYCWSDIYPNSGYLNDPGNCQQGNVSIDSTDRISQTGFYLADNPFSSLIGCPLNGRWTIEICDTWQSDNGYIFNWTLDLAPSLLPQAWGYEAVIDSTWVEGPFIVGYQNGSTLICPSDTGTFQYDLFFADEFGCVWDTNVLMHVNPLPEVDLGPDTAFCAGPVMTLTAGTSPNTFLWNTNQTTPSIQVTNGGMYSVEVASPLNCFSTDTIQVTIRPRPIPLLIRHD